MLVLHLTFGHNVHFRGWRKEYVPFSQKPGVQLLVLTLNGLQPCITSTLGGSDISGSWGT